MPEKADGRFLSHVVWLLQAQFKRHVLNVFSLVLEQAPTSQPHVRQLSSASTYCLCLSHFRPILPFHLCETLSSRHSCLIPKLHFPFSIRHVPTPFIVLVFDNIPYLAPQWVLGSPIF